MHVHLFAAHKDRFGPTIDVPPCTVVGELSKALALLHPEANPPWGLCRIAVNCEFGTAETPISEGDELAVIPPVSGG